MKEQKSGHIVTISSLAAITGTPHNINYTTTKFAVRGFMESLAIDLYHQGYGNLINTTVVYPAIISTNDEVLRMCDLIKRKSYGNAMYSLKEVARTVVDAIKSNKEVDVIPKVFYFFGYLM